MTDFNREPGATGGCLCGGIRYRVEAPLRHVVACHCRQCCVTHGNFAAYTAVAKSALTLTASTNLTWYRSSTAARRGFCSRCGASLFWDHANKNYMAIAAGSLDDCSGLRTTSHIHVESKPGYYDLHDDLPWHPAGLTTSR